VLPAVPVAPPPAPATPVAPNPAPANPPTMLPPPNLVSIVQKPYMSNTNLAASIQWSLNPSSTLSNFVLEYGPSTTNFTNSAGLSPPSNGVGAIDVYTLVAGTFYFRISAQAPDGSDVHSNVYGVKIPNSPTLTYTNVGN